MYLTTACASILGLHKRTNNVKYHWCTRYAVGANFHLRKRSLVGNYSRPKLTFTEQLFRYILAQFNAVKGMCFWSVFLSADDNRPA